ncbi:MAG TPA: toprim domain-containing protein [Desulfobacteria bacterium]|nr:toprim domain-containing protein [Desulfobacteria bacterium]
MDDRVIIVEGKTDKLRLKQVLAEPVDIVCTYGTLSLAKLDQFILSLQDREVYVITDADFSGNKLRRQLKQELPNAKHLYTRTMYGQVANTPLEYLAKLLGDAHFSVKEEFLK